MILPKTKNNILNALKQKNREIKGQGAGGSIKKRFIQEALVNLDSKLEFDDGRDNIQHLTGIRVRKIGRLYF